MAVAANFARQARIARSDGAVHVSKPGIGSVAAGPGDAAGGTGAGSTASAAADAVAAGVPEGFGVALAEGRAEPGRNAESGRSPASSGDGWTASGRLVGWADADADAAVDVGAGTCAGAGLADCGMTSWMLASTPPPTPGSPPQGAGIRAAD